MTGLSGNVIILTVLYYGGSLVTDDLISVGQFSSLPFLKLIFLIFVKFLFLGNLTSFIMYSAYVGIGIFKNLFYYLKGWLLQFEYPLIDRNVRFTTLSFEPLSDQGYMRYYYYQLLLLDQRADLCCSCNKGKRNFKTFLRN